MSDSDRKDQAREQQRHLAEEKRERGRRDRLRREIEGVALNYRDEPEWIGQYLAEQVGLSQADLNAIEELLYSIGGVPMVARAFATAGLIQAPDAMPARATTKDWLAGRIPEIYDRSRLSGLVAVIQEEWGVDSEGRRDRAVVPPPRRESWADVHGQRRRQIVNETLSELREARVRLMARRTQRSPTLADVEKLAAEGASTAPFERGLDAQPGGVHERHVDEVVGDMSAKEELDRATGRVANWLGVPATYLRVRTDETARARTEARGATGLVEAGEILLHPDRLDPSTQQGARILAHEAVHVVQQRDVSVATGETRASQADAEREASLLADRFGKGESAFRPRQVLAHSASAADRDADGVLEELEAEIDEGEDEGPQEAGTPSDGAAGTSSGKETSPSGNGRNDAADCVEEPPEPQWGPEHGLSGASPETAPTAAAPRAPTTYREQILKYFRDNPTIEFGVLINEIRTGYDKRLRGRELKRALRALTKIENALANEKPSLREGYNAALLKLPLHEVQRFNRSQKGPRTIRRQLPSPRPLLTQYVEDDKGAFRYVRMCSDDELRRHLAELVDSEQGAPLLQKVKEKAKEVTTILRRALPTIEPRIDLATLHKLVRYSRPSDVLEAMRESAAVPKDARKALGDLYKASADHFKRVVRQEFGPLHVRKKAEFIGEAVSLCDPRFKPRRLEKAEFERYSNLMDAAARMGFRDEMEIAISEAEIEFMYGVFSEELKKSRFNAAVFELQMPKYVEYIKFIHLRPWKTFLSATVPPKAMRSLVAFHAFHADYKVLFDLQEDIRQVTTPGAIDIVMQISQAMSAAGSRINTEARRVIYIRSW